MKKLANPLEDFIWEETSTFNGERAVREIREQIPLEQELLRFRIGEAYFSFMQDSGKSNPSEVDFDFTGEDSKRFVDKYLMPRLRKHLWDNSYIVNDPTKTPKEVGIRPEAYDSILRNVIGMSAPQMTNLFGERKVTHELIGQVGNQAAENLAKYKTQEIFAPLESRVELERARDFLYEAFRKDGLTITRPAELDINRTAEFISRYARGLHREYGFLQENRDMITTSKIVPASGAERTAVERTRNRK
ncbi:hypothetical protein D6745_01720 [Candidatus Woesearchaeota archaeon]|nr:MAG: hypothetical protein D6745_01720 [Candidatus Woesearchaeota archaeon]